MWKKREYIYTLYNSSHSRNIPPLLHGRGWWAVVWKDMGGYIDMWTHEIGDMSPPPRNVNSESKTYQ